MIVIIIIIGKRMQELVGSLLIHMMRYQQLLSLLWLAYFLFHR